MGQGLSWLFTKASISIDYNNNRFLFLPCPVNISNFINTIVDSQ